VLGNLGTYSIDLEDHEFMLVLPGLHYTCQHHQFFDKFYDPSIIKLAQIQQVESHLISCLDHSNLFLAMCMILFHNCMVYNCIRLLSVSHSICRLASLGSCSHSYHCLESMEEDSSCIDSNYLCFP